MGTRRPGRGSRRFPASAASAFDLSLFAASIGSSIEWWFDADAAYITLATGVSQWADRSGNANHAAQATGAAQPAYSASVAALNNKPAVNFDGTDDVLARATFTQGACTQPNTIFLVAAPDDTGTALASGQLMVDGGSAGTARHVIDITASAATTSVSDLFAGAALISSPAFTSTGGHVFEGVFNGASSIVSVDGARSTATGAGGAQNMNGITIGNRFATSFYFDGHIAEMFMLSGALDATQRATVRAWLASKYGLTLV